MGVLADRVRSDYESLNSADAERVAGHLCADAARNYKCPAPHIGAPAIAHNAALGVGALAARWPREPAPEGSTECSITFRDTHTARRCLDRGADFLASPGQRICEVRAYYHEPVPGKRSGDLVGFDPAGRGQVTPG